MDATEKHLHLVSDSTGETVQATARACLAQFEGGAPSLREHRWTLVRAPSDLERVEAGLRKYPGAVMYTLVDPQTDRGLRTLCRSIGVPALSVLAPSMEFLLRYLGGTITRRPGIQHKIMDGEYFSRIDAIEFAISHDDGAGLAGLSSADVVLVGVSRTSKTPTCMYLANRGVRAANIPFVAAIALPEELHRLSGDPNAPLVVGLTREPESLVDLRRNRLTMLSAGAGRGEYANPDAVREEVTACRRFCAARGWKVIDTTRRSIEETAAEILRLLERRDAPF